MARNLRYQFAMSNTKFNQDIEEVSRFFGSHSKASGWLGYAHASSYRSARAKRPMLAVRLLHFAALSLRLQRLVVELRKQLNDMRKLAD